MEDEDVVQLPIDGVLDLHTFRPAEVRELVPDYLAACKAKGIFTVRIIHGKGTGQLRRLVISVLRSVGDVVSFRPGREEEGGWGATIVELRRR